MATIDIISFFDFNFYDYANFLQNISSRFLSNSHTINWKYISSDKNMYIKNWERIPITIPKDTHNSMLHGIALNEAIKFASADYTIIIDVDIAILYPNWDEIVVRELQNGISFFGFEPPPSNKRGNQNFPCVFFMAFRTDVKECMEFDFRPIVDEKDHLHRQEIISLSDSISFDKNIGDVIKCDTGWKIPDLAFKAGYNSNVIPYSVIKLLPYKDKAQKSLCKTKPTHMAEWHYNYKLFGTHKQAARSHSLNNSDYGIAWKERILLYIKKNFGEIL